MIDKLIRTIRFFLKLIIICTVVGAIAFGSWLSVIKVRPDELAVLEDIRNARITGVYTEGKHFIWQACIPVVYKVHILPLSSVKTWDITIPIPNPTISEKPCLKILVPISFTCSIMPQKISDIQILLSGGAKLDSEIKKFLEGFIANEINDKLETKYQRNAVVSGINSAVKNSAEKLDAIYGKKGILVSGVVLYAPVMLPTDEEYARAVRELSELERVKFENEKSFLFLNQKIREERLLNTELYTKLREMSKIIKENPDILKYLYIDKMSDNVKIIISSDKTGFPQALESEIRENVPVQSKKKDIDNLR